MSNTKELPTAPDWSKAPDKAMWFAVDRVFGYGIGWWYLDEPIPHDRHTIYVGNIIASAGYFNPETWKESLQKRPE